MENKNLIQVQPEVGKMAKAGAVFLILWGILHIWVGAEGAHQYFASDVGSLWKMLVGGKNAPFEAIQISADTITANAQKHLILNFCLDVGGYGVLGIILAFLIYKKGSWSAYFIALIAIGICDLSFAFSMVTSGIIELNWGTVSGPIIWVVAIILIPFGLPKFHPKTSLN